MSVADIRMTAAPPTIADETRRQAALLQAIRRLGPLSPALRVAPAQAGPALAAWRGNASAQAAKALGAVFPTVERMLGDLDFARLADAFRDAAPPTCGDLGEWGGALPGFVEAQIGLRAWPWLADTARLDLAMHRSARAADAVVDLASFERLGSLAPESLRLALAPGTALIESAWPLATIHQAHGAAEAEADAAFAAVREAIETKRGESVMIVREGWRATVHRAEGAEVAWLRGLLAGRTLAESLDRAGTGFAFADWLATAVRRSWLEGVLRVGSNEPGKWDEA